MNDPYLTLLVVAPANSGLGHKPYRKKPLFTITMDSLLAIVMDTPARSRRLSQLVTDANDSPSTFQHTLFQAVLLASMVSMYLRCGDLLRRRPGSTLVKTLFWDLAFRGCEAAFIFSLTPETSAFEARLLVVYDIALAFLVHDSAIVAMLATITIVVDMMNGWETLMDAL